MGMAALFVEELRIQDMGGSLWGSWSPGCVNLLMLDVIPTRVLGLPPNNRNWARGQTRNSRKALLGLLRLQEGAKTTNRFPFLLLRVG